MVPCPRCKSYSNQNIVEEYPAKDGKVTRKMKCGYCDEQYNATWYKTSIKLSIFDDCSKKEECEDCYQVCQRRRAKLNLT